MSGEPCGEHRPPEGPNEDVGFCLDCWCMTWTLRPENEQYGLHLDDCSLPVRHEGSCKPGGSGHAPLPVVRGWWGEDTNADIEDARRRHADG